MQGLEDTMSTYNGRLGTVRQRLERLRQNALMLEAIADRAIKGPQGGSATSTSVPPSPKA